jgi:hypothetical protein
MIMDLVRASRTVAATIERRTLLARRVGKYDLQQMPSIILDSDGIEFSTYEIKTENRIRILFTLRRRIIQVFGLRISPNR